MKGQPKIGALSSPSLDDLLPSSPSLDDLFTDSSKNKNRRNRWHSSKNANQPSTNYRLTRDDDDDNDDADDDDTISSCEKQFSQVQ